MIEAPPALSAVTRRRDTGMLALLTTRASLIENIVALHHLNSHQFPGFTTLGSALDRALNRLVRFQARYGDVIAYADLSA